MAKIMKAASENALAREILSTRKHTTAATAKHPNGISLQNLFLTRSDGRDVHGRVNCAKTGYVRQSGNCAVSYQTSASGKEYIVVTGKAQGAWQAVYDHENMYQTFTQ